jgi:hypothetical protein
MCYAEKVGSMRIIPINTNPKAQLGLPSVGMLGQIGSMMAKPKEPGERAFDMYMAEFERIEGLGSLGRVKWEHMWPSGKAAYALLESKMNLDGNITNNSSMLEAILDLDKAEQQKIYKLLWANGCRI